MALVASGAQTFCADYSFLEGVPLPDIARALQKVFESAESEVDKSMLEFINSIVKNLDDGETDINIIKDSIDRILDDISADQAMELQATVSNVLQEKVPTIDKSPVDQADPEGGIIASATEFARTVITHNITKIVVGSSVMSLTTSYVVKMYNEKYGKKIDRVKASAIAFVATATAMTGYYYGADLYAYLRPAA